jgi:signal transduction histidine kinase
MSVASPVQSEPFAGRPLQSPLEEENRVLIVAPTGNDAPLTLQVLSKSHIQATICGDVAELCRELDGQFAAILLAEETLSADSVAALIETLARQPAWSDIPVLIITSGGEADRSRLRRLAMFGPGANVTLLERPFRPGTLVSSVQTALRARLRQYQVRDLLREVSSARDAAEDANQAKDDFLAALSHELRTPLNPVLLLATEAAENDNVPAEVRADFDTIAKNVMLEARLIDDLLDLTRITRGKLTLDFQRVPLHGVIRDAVANVEREMKEKELSLSLDFWDANPVVEGDPVRLQQVLWNVLKNAAKFTGRRGEVRVTTRPGAGPNAGRVIVEISDNGIGISPGEIGRIFDAFAQGNHGEKQNLHRFGGLGLGLAISRSLVELHSGRIRAFSSGVGRGSTFTIDLPLAAGPPSGR